jgi:hypothetical protein
MAAMVEGEGAADIRVGRAERVRRRGRVIGEYIADRGCCAMMVLY